MQVDGVGERGLAAIAGAQRGLVHRGQLQELGITRGSYNHRVASGALRHVLPGVLAVVDPLLEPWAAATAALHYAGENALISNDRDR